MIRPIPQDEKATYRMTRPHHIARPVSPYPDWDTADTDHQPVPFRMQWQAFWQNMTPSAGDQGWLWIRLCCGGWLLSQGLNALQSPLAVARASGQLELWGAHHPFFLYQDLIHHLWLPHAALWTGLGGILQCLLGVGILVGLCYRLSAMVWLGMSLHLLLASGHIHPDRLLLLSLQSALAGGLWWSRSGLLYGLDRWLMPVAYTTLSAVADRFAGVAWLQTGPLALLMNHVLHSLEENAAWLMAHGQARSVQVLSQAAPAMPQRPKTGPRLSLLEAQYRRERGLTLTDTQDIDADDDDEEEDWDDNDEALSDWDDTDDADDEMPSYLPAPKQAPIAVELPFPSAARKPTPAATPSRKARSPVLHLKPRKTSARDQQNWERQWAAAKEASRSKPIATDNDGTGPRRRQR